MKIWVSGNNDVVKVHHYDKKEMNEKIEPTACFSSLLYYFFSGVYYATPIYYLIIQKAIIFESRSYLKSIDWSGCLCLCWFNKLWNYSTWLFFFLLSHISPQSRLLAHFTQLFTQREMQGKEKEKEFREIKKFHFCFTAVTRTTKRERYCMKTFVILLMLLLLCTLCLAKNEII